MTEETMGRRMARLRARSGLSLEEVAKAAGYKGRSSVQRFFEPDYDRAFAPDVATRLIEALAGKGNPPISSQEIVAAAGLQFVADSGRTFLPGDAVRNVGALPRDVPVYGTALGGEASYARAEGSGRVSIEQGTLDQAEILGHLRRPPALDGLASVYGVYVAGESMYPRFNDGEAQYVDPRRPAAIGDDVVVHLRSEDEHEGERVSAVLIKRLKRRTAAFVELEQFNPPALFRIESARVKMVHRIIPPGELLG